MFIFYIELCQHANSKRTFNLPNYSGAKLITGNNIPVTGNGTALGLTNGAEQGGLTSKNDNISSVIFTHISAQTSKYNTNVTSSGTGISITGMVGVLGITTDPTKSGMVADMSNFQNVLYCIRY